MLYHFGHAVRINSDPLLSFEIEISKEDVFENFSNDEAPELGVRLTLAGTPTPFSNHIFVPSDTHAIVEIERATYMLQSHCEAKLPKLTVLGTRYSEDACII